MSEIAITILLSLVLLFSIVGIILVIIWVNRNTFGSSVKGRISDFVRPDVSEGIIPTNIDGVPEVLATRFQKFRSWLNKILIGLSSEQLQVKISSAYWPITDVEFIVVRILAAVLGLAVGWMAMGSILAGIFLGILMIFLPPVVLERSIIQRQNKFHNQLMDVLIMIKGAVQAGYSLPQSLDLAVKEMPSPSSEEFNRVLREVRFGFPLEQALTNLSERMENDDLHIVITAIIINSQVGGNLSTVLESTIETIRDRMQLSSEVRSLTSYARYVGNFLSFLPFLAGIAIFLLTPDYFKSVTNSLIVQIIFTAALIGIVLGNIWIRKIATIKV